MKITIETIETGYLVATQWGMYAFNDALELLRFVKDEINPGSRHDENRIYVIEAPGDKHEKFTDNHYNFIFGEEDDKCKGS